MTFYDVQYKKQFIDERTFFYYMNNILIECSADCSSLQSFLIHIEQTSNDRHFHLMNSFFFRYKYFIFYCLILIIVVKTSLLREVISFTIST